jgi:general nucleoside transport system permease protein
MSGGMAPGEIPRWVDYLLVPLVNLAVALLLSGLVVIAIGANPIDALNSLLFGAVGYPEAIGFTLYYATNFIFTGLSVAVAFHAGLFNIGGEGQAYIGGLGVGLVCLVLDQWPLVLVFPIAVAAAALFGAAWAFIPAYLQAKRGSHIVITTIMFNFIASALMTYLLVDVLVQPGQQAPRSRDFAPGVRLPYAKDLMNALGIDIGEPPLNFASLLAVLACVLVWLFIWHTRWGYEVRTVGHSERAARYAGISRTRAIVLAMMVSGALSGLVGVNDIMGVHHYLLVGWTGGVGFVGIAVALMGRNHPVGIAMAALLFGALYQGGSEIAFDIPQITKEMVVVIQGLVILFCGALENMFKPQIAVLFRRRTVVEAA